MEAVYQNNRWSRGWSLNSPSYSLSHIFQEAFRYWPCTRAVRPDVSHIWNQSIDNFRRDHFLWVLGILRVQTTKLLAIKSTWRWLRLNYKKECVQQRIHMRTAWYVHPPALTGADYSAIDKLLEGSLIRCTCDTEAIYVRLAARISNSEVRWTSRSFWI